MTDASNPEKFLKNNPRLIYSDVDFKLKKDNSGNISKVTGGESISQSIKTILSTYPGERHMLPEFGSRLREYLFDPIDIDTLELMEAEIEIALEQWEPRITVKNLDITEDVNKNQLVINIFYTMIDTGVDDVFEGRVQRP